MKVLLFFLSYCIMAGITIVINIIVYDKWEIGFDADIDLGIVLIMSVFWIITLIPLAFYWSAKIAMYYTEDK